MNHRPGMRRTLGGGQTDAELFFEELVGPPAGGHHALEVQSLEGSSVDGELDSFFSELTGEERVAEAEWVEGTPSLDGELDSFFSELTGEAVPAPLLARRGELPRAKEVEQRPTVELSTEQGPSQAAGTRPVLTLTQPAPLSVWALLLEPEKPDFLTQGIAQGSALWTTVTGSGPLTVTAGGAANGSGDRAGAAAVRADERGLVVAGQVDPGATGVQIQVLTAAGAPIPLRTSPTTTATTTQLAATLGAPAPGATSRSFEAVVFLDAPSTRFGRVQVKVDAAGLPSAVSATADVLLVGVQVALVDDRASGADGRTRGPVRTEADERVVVDFLVSPQATRQLLSDQTRARRMVIYEIATRARALGGSAAAVVTQPEMPMWMAELQLVGVDAAALASFMRARAAAPGGRRTLALTAQWTLATSWDGPNAASATRPYRSTKDWTATTSAQIALDTAGTAIDGLQPTGEVRGAFTPAPAPPGFPVTGRRVAQVMAGGITRRWGRRSTTALVPATIVEHQPLLVDAAGREIMRGGDGELRLTSLSIDGAPVDPGRVATAAGTVAPPAATPLATVPTFRVQGVNPAVADRQPLVEALVDEYVRAHATDPWVAVLPLAAWQITVWRVLQHESVGGRHFDDRGTGRVGVGGQFFGDERDMPMFGAPAGYGWGQLDNPPVSDDAAWSFTDNVRSAIHRLLHDKGQAAYNAMHAHFPTPIDQRAQAVFRRETVRRYNGSTELRWNGSDWEISPGLSQRTNPSDVSSRPNSHLDYPNQVLGTTVVYFTGTGAAATFPWPIAFPATQYGPGI